MTGRVHDRLGALYDDYRMVRRLHDVPPHEVYEVRVEGDRAVYKGDTEPRGRAATEGAVTRVIADRTAVPVPAVRHVGADFYIADWHPAAPEPGATLDEEPAWPERAGRGLATLHAETRPLVEGYGQPSPDGGRLVADHGSWSAAAVASLRERRGTLEDHGCEEADAAVVARVADLLADRPGAFEGAGLPVCCHGWWSPEHVAVRKEGVACVVDFEHALLAPAEWDYWRAAVPTFVAGDETELAAFREGYESVRPLPAGVDDRAPWFRLLCGTYYLESLYVQDQHGPVTIRERAAALRERLSDRLEQR